MGFLTRVAMIGNSDKCADMCSNLKNIDSYIYFIENFLGISNKTEYI